MSGMHGPEGGGAQQCAPPTRPGGPPHRSQRAELPHWAPASGSGSEALRREGMHHAGWWEPPVRETVHPAPGQPGPLAAAPKPMHQCRVTWDRKTATASVVARARRSRRSALAARCVSHAPAPGSGRCLRRLSSILISASFARIRLAIVMRLTQNRPALARRADVRQAQEVERLRFAQTPLASLPGRMPPELDQPGLVRVQLQPELREPLAKLRQELPRILLGPRSRR